MRKHSWRLLLVVNVLFLLWVIEALGSEPSGPGCFQGFVAGDCAGGRTEISVLMIVALWAIFDLVLGVITLMRDREEEWPERQQRPAE